MQHAFWAEPPAPAHPARAPLRHTPRQPLRAAATQPPRNWIAVACADHARRGCAEPGAGYMQVCHGKAAPLKRLRAGDRVAYYAPTVTVRGTDRLQAFVSIGTVLAGDAYAVDMGGGFVPHRKDVAYVPAREAPIHPLLAQLEFIEDPRHWGAKFRFGLFAISEHDMRVIARAMEVQEDLLFN